MSIKNILQKLNSRDFRIIPKISNKFKVTLVFALIISTIIFTKSSFAKNIFQIKQEAISKGNNQESWLDEALSSNLMSFQIMLSGTFPDSFFGSTAPTSYYKPGGFIGATNQLISYAFIPPISGIEYIAQVKDDFLGKPAYAQGYGFNSLKKGILPLWTIFRNAIYSLFSIIFIIIGIMLMLRIKISPQAVITIQSSIPKIITTLILVTFSYAIAGLCLDLMNFVLAFVLGLLFKGTGKDLSDSLFTKIGLEDFGIKYNFQNLNNLSLDTFSKLVNKMVPTLEMTILGGTIGAIVGLFTGIVTTVVTAATGALLVSAVISILVVVSVVSFLFGLIKAYIAILLQIIFAPLEIAMGAFPNSKTGFSTWITKLISNLAIFPISILFLVIVNILIDYIGSDLWVPVILNNSGGMGMGVDSFVSVMVGIGALFMLPKLPSLIPEFIFQIKPSPWGKAIGEGYSGSFIGAGVKTGVKGVQEAAVSGISSKVTGAVGTAKGNFNQAYNASGIGNAQQTEAANKKTKNVQQGPRDIQPVSGSKPPLGGR